MHHYLLRRTLAKPARQHRQARRGPKRHDAAAEKTADAHSVLLGPGPISEPGGVPLQSSSGSQLVLLRRQTGWAEPALPQRSRDSQQRDCRAGQVTVRLPNRGWARAPSSLQHRQPQTPPSRAVPKAQCFHMAAPLCLATAAALCNMVISPHHEDRDARLQTGSPTPI